MNFEEIIDQVSKHLRQEKRISYRALKRRFDLDDDDIDDIKDELIEAKRIAKDENDKVLVWVEGKSNEDSDRDSQEEAERRHLTVVFFDLANSTTLSNTLDPEVYRDLILTYQRLVVSAIAPFEGHIAQYLGDGILAYFGYPVARENDAQAAIEGAIEAIHSIIEMAAPLKQQYNIEFAARAGIESGVVVVGNVGSGDHSTQIALGKTPNVAARLQSVAPLNGIVVGSATYSLVKTSFHFSPLGELSLKGIEKPVAAYVLEKRHKPSSGFRIPEQNRLVSLQGRESTLDALRDIWLRTTDAKGNVVQIYGDAGLGKSRLIKELVETVDDAHDVSILKANSIHSSSYLFPVIEYLSTRMGISDEDSQETRKQKLVSTLASLDVRDQQSQAVIASLLSLSPDLFEPLQVTAQRRRQLVLEILRQLLEALTGSGRILCIFEDIHWCDPSSIEFIEYLIQDPVPGLMLVITSRPCFRPEGASIPCLELQPLTRSEAEQLVLDIDEDGILAKETVLKIVEKADGVPLFVEELTNTVLSDQRQAAIESRLGDSEIKIPNTLRDSLTSRLDRMSTGKKVAQLGSIIGREFPEEVLQELWEGSSVSMQTGLHELIASGLVLQERADHRLVFVFKHALIRDAAYDSLLVSSRVNHHASLGVLLESKFDHITTSSPEVVAYHNYSGKKYKKALKYWQKAIENAQVHSAHEEALAHIDSALESLDKIPNFKKREEIKMALLFHLGASVIATEGYGAPRVGEAYHQALTLCTSIQDEKARFDAIQGVAAFYLLRGELDRALDLVVELEAIARDLGETEYELEASLRMAICQSILGNLEVSRVLFEKVLDLCELERDAEHRYRYGQDSKVACLCHYSLVLWLMGYPDQSLERIDEAVALAEQIAHPFSLSWALFYSGLVRYLRREKDQVADSADKLTSLSIEQAFAYRLAQANILNGWASPDFEDGAMNIRRSLETIEATGALTYATYYYAVLSEVELNFSPASALDTIQSGLNIAEKTKELVFYPELLRLQAEILLRDSGNRQKATELLDRAADLARRQGAKSLSLRIAVSRYHMDPGTEAREELESWLGEISEGLESVDIIDARALING
jgi:class 3 adenylate cyclase/tetratricopeptide (TPR) repeat protein